MRTPPCIPHQLSGLRRRDPSGTMTAFADMMRKQIVMPAHLMDDLEHQGRTGRSLFKDFSSVAQMTGTYTSHVRCRAAVPFRPWVAGRAPWLTSSLQFDAVWVRVGKSLGQSGEAA